MLYTLAASCPLGDALPISAAQIKLQTQTDVGAAAQYVCVKGSLESNIMWHICMQMSMQNYQVHEWPIGVQLQLNSVDSQAC